MGLSEATKKSLDEELFEYNSIARQIAIRKVEIETQKEHDDNIGGSRSGHISKIPEELAIKFSEDRRIQHLEQFRADVEHCYKNMLTDEQRDIFDLRWLIDEANTWEEIAHKMNYSEKSMYRKREKILEKYAMAKGKM